MNSFLKGVITGAVIVLTGVLIIWVLRFFYNRDRRLYEFIKREGEIEAVREDVITRDPYEFLDDPGVRGAADSGIERLNRKRDEILYRGRSTGND